MVILENKKKSIAQAAVKKQPIYFAISSFSLEYSLGKISKFSFYV